jgi:glutamate--cysteine ligase
MDAWWNMDPRITHPVPTGPDPAADWARYALDAPLTCVRRADGDWNPPPGVTFRDWVAGALPVQPTADDLDYHLTTLFPPVRPREYLEIRYLDAQPDRDWFAPVAVLAALLADEETTAAALDIAAPTADRWKQAMRFGLADEPLRRTATAVLDLALRRLSLPHDLCVLVNDTVQRRLS